LPIGTQDAILPYTGKVLSVLHPSLQDRIDDLRQQFATNRPFRHVVIDPFLAPEFCEDLIAGFPAFDPGRAQSENGTVGRKAVISDLVNLGAAYSQFDGLMRDPEFLSLTGRITGIPDLLYDPEYIGGGTHENLDGQELDSHVDFNYHPTAHWHRRLNLIVFLNPEWEESWGGYLELLRDPFEAEAERQVVAPLANRAVIFETSEVSWHGFRRIRLPAGKQTSRRSIAVYFYTKQRPPEETAPSHATIYYQRPLPEHLRAGYTLREEDRVELETLLTRRDGTIRFLYERELEFSKTMEERERAAKKAMEDVAASLSFRIGRALTAPGRALRSILRASPGPR
jgi:Rps23 Pro-64 3,4-dihydroxylase Tpa1-like proline 4-hydroxylase